MKAVRPILILFACCLMPGCSVDNSQAKFEPLDKPGVEDSLERYKGKVVLVDFWATWCGPCRMISSKVEDLYLKYKDKGLVVLAITDEDRATVEAYARNRTATYPIVIDAEGKSNQLFKVTALPTLVLVGKNGSVIKKVVGAAPNLNMFDKAISESL